MMLARRGRRLWSLTTLLIAAAFAAGACGGGDRSGEDGGARPPLAPVAVGTPISVGPSPSALAVGGGAVWVVDAAAGTLTRIDAASRSVTRRVRVPGGPFAVAVGEGAAWVAAGDGRVRGFDLRTGRPSGADALVRGANGIAAGAGGVWVTSRIAGTVTRVDPRSRRADRAIGVGRGPADVAVGAGAVWVLNAGDGTVSRVHAPAARVTATVRVGAPQALALTIGEGGVWVARARGELGERLEVVRLDPEEQEVTGEAVAVTGAIPLDLVAAGGSVWSTDAGDLRRTGSPRRGGVSRLDAERQRLAGPPIRTGQGPSAVAAGEGAVWVANSGDGTVTPIRSP